MVLLLVESVGSERIGHGVASVPTDYGVRPCSVHTLEEQLGLVPGTKSKIEDGSATGTFVTLGAAVADFR